MKDEAIKQEILSQLRLQMYNNFVNVNFQPIENCYEQAYERCKESLSALKDKYLNPDGTPNFLIYHSGCWALYLYYLANTIQKHGGGVCAEQVYYLNKILHSVDWYCDIELPKHFMAEHPVGSVLGRAKYGDYLYIYQGVTIGGNIRLDTGKIEYPIIEDNVLMYSNAKILGGAHIGKNVILSANSCVINENIPDESIVFGVSPDLVIKNKPREIRISTKLNWNIKNEGDYCYEVL